MFFGTLLFAHPIQRSAVLSHPLSASAPVLLRHFTPAMRQTDGDQPVFGLVVVWWLGMIQMCQYIYSYLSYTYFNRIAGRLCS